MTTPLLALFEEARAELEPSAVQIAVGRARLKAVLGAPASGSPVALGAAGVVGAGVIAIVIAFATRGDVSAETPAPQPPPEAVVVAPPPAVTVTPIEPAVPAVIVPAPAAPIAPAPRRRARPAEAPVAAAAGDDALAREVRLLRDARTALASRALHDARAALAEHARAFADPQLAQEAALLAIELACASGDVSAARTSIHDFVERWPRSSKRARAERACPSLTEEVTDAP